LCGHTVLNLNDPSAGSPTEQVPNKSHLPLLALQFSPSSEQALVFLVASTIS
jgi:hypothetical protein